MNRWIVRGNLIVERQVRNDQILVCENGMITYVGPGQGEKPDLVVDSGYIAPGYIDIHIHGAKGHDVMDGTVESLAEIARSLATHGVTGYMATTMTADLPRLAEVLTVCREFARRESPGAELLGVHLEGPWIHPRHKGAQNEDFIVAPTIQDAEALRQAAGGLLKIVSLAPEQPGAKDVIAHLSALGVRVSIGHSDARYEQVKEAIHYGLSHVTHCFNAMRGLHHREPGAVGAAMFHDELTAELIADGIHVHPVVMSLLHRIKTTDRTVLVSDGMRAVDMEDGVYDLGGQRVYVRGGVARLGDGTLAGSTLTLDRAVQNMVRLCGVPIPDAVAMASEIPARVIGCADRKGRLAVGCDADFSVLDRDLNVLRTFVGGREVS